MGDIALALGGVGAEIMASVALSKIKASKHQKPEKHRKPTLVARRAKSGREDLETLESLVYGAQPNSDWEKLEAITFAKTGKTKTRKRKQQERSSLNPTTERAPGGSADLKELEKLAYGDESACGEPTVPVEPLDSLSAKPEIKEEGNVEMPKTTENCCSYVAPNHVIQPTSMLHMILCVNCARASNSEFVVLRSDGSMIYNVFQCVACQAKNAAVYNVLQCST
jgi:hypothetical protein